MLGKCLKHEWIETWIIGFACCAALILLSLIAFIVLPLVPDMMESDVGKIILPIFMFTMIVMGGAAIFGTAFLGRYYYFYRYYKNLFTDQGYLMHTLPVRTSDLVNSKFIVAIIWQYLIGASYIIAFFLVTGGFYGMIGRNELTYFEFLKGIAEGLGDIFSIGWFAIGTAVVIAIIYPVMDMLLMYLAVDIGQLGKKNRLILSICALVGISFAKRFVANIASIISAFANVSKYATRGITTDMMLDQYNVTFVIVLIFEIVTIVGCYVLNMHIVKNKLNLE